MFVGICDAAAVTDAPEFLSPRFQGWKAHLLLFAATGVLLALAFPLPGWSWLGFVALAPAAVAVGASRSPRRVFVASFVVFSLWFVWMLRWLWPVTGPGVLALSPFTALFPAVALWAANVAHHRGRIPMILALPVCWVAAEWLRSTQPWGGFGWFLLGHTGSASGGGAGPAPWAMLAAVGGVPIVSVLLAASATALVVALGQGREGLRSQALKRRFRSLLVVSSILACTILWQMASRAGSAEGGVQVAALQTNNPHSNRVSPTYEGLAAEFRVLAGLHRDAAEHDPPPALILWPETIVYGPFNRDASGFDQSPFATAARELIEECGIPTVVGGSFSLDEAGAPRHNSAYFVRPGTLKSADWPRHDKVHRVPFGEYIPGPAWLKTLVLNRFSPYDFDYTLTEGVLGDPFELELGGGRIVRLATPICFEDTDPKLTRQMADGGADALLNLTTSGWFGHLPSADRPGGGLAWRSVRAQHLQVAGFRSIETGLPTLRSVNTGTSALITGAGFIREALPAGEPGVLRGELPLASEPGRTLNLRGGHLFAPAVTCLATCFLAIGLFRRRSQARPEASGPNAVSNPPAA